VLKKHKTGITRACRVCSVSTSAYYYQGKKRDDGDIQDQLLKLAKEHIRWGFDKMFRYLRNQGYPWNHKRVYRIYCELKLNLRVKAKKRIPVRDKKSLEQPLHPNMCWSIDFMSDVLISGQRFRSFNVLDDFNREGLRIETALSMPARFVTDILDQIAEERGYPDMIRVDNGPEFISRHFQNWAKKRHILLHYIQPGKPAQNGYIERFNRTYREAMIRIFLNH
jgi:putative transposase